MIVRWYLAPLEAVQLPNGRVVRGSRLMRYYRGAPARVSIIKTDNGAVGAWALTRFEADAADHALADRDRSIIALPDMLDTYSDNKISRAIRDQLAARGIDVTAPPEDLLRVPTMADAWRRISRAMVARHRERTATPADLDTDATPIRVGPETL